MRVSDFDFDLPPDLIAQHPQPRGTSRLLVVYRHEQRWEERSIRDLPQLLAPGDLLVANDTRVFPARLLGHRVPSGGAVECLLLEPLDGDEWLALVHPGQKLKPGARIVFDNPEHAPGVEIQGEILARRYFGKRLIRLHLDRTSGSGPQASEGHRQALGPDPELVQAIDAIGHVPLPPYIHRSDEPDDRHRYQTVFAHERGSIAAPTAGLHFDNALLDALGAAGIEWATITLHVGYGTFKPVRVERVEDHDVDGERYVVSAETSAAIDRVNRRGGRLVAVGTTTTRALESVAAAAGAVVPHAGETTLFIAPGHHFRAVDALLTNFHLPRSSLLMLVAAFAGRDLTLAAYRDAITRGFRFYSYGDAMLIA